MVLFLHQIKPIPGSEDKIPVIVFVNPKSGGNQVLIWISLEKNIYFPFQVREILSEISTH